MIKEIKIENFKSIQSLNLELGRLNVFIGANGSGKSNILEAIAMGGAAIDNKLDNEFLVNRGFRSVDLKSIPSGFTANENDSSLIIFSDDENRKQEMSIANLKSKKLSFGSGKQKISVEKNYKEPIITEPQLLDAKGLEDFFQGLNESERIHFFSIAKQFIESRDNNEGKYLETSFFIFTPENYFLRRFEEESQIKPLGIRGEGLFNHVADIFKNKPAYFTEINKHLQLLDWFEGFEIPNDLMFTERRIKIKDQFLKTGLQYIDQRSANEGFLYLLFYLTLFISDETPKFFAIDNIDNAMNPKLGSELIRVLSKLAKEHDKQTILTTHNPSVLDGLDLNDDEQRLFVVYRNGDGHTKIKRVFKKAMPAGVAPMALSEMFLKGIIGGLPKNF